MKPRLFFVTGSDTGVGKTILAGLLTRYLRQCGVNVVALKPICSGGRGDAQILHEAAGRVLQMDEVNPWHYRRPLAPFLAARLERRPVYLREVCAHIKQVACRFDFVVVEGAGGLLSPLGEDFDSRDLIGALRATPIVVCANRLGAVNQALLVLEALPVRTATRAKTVLSDVQLDASSDTNLKLLGERLGKHRVHRLPKVNCRTAIPVRIQTLLARLTNR